MISNKRDFATVSFFFVMIVMFLMQLSSAEAATFTTKTIKEETPTQIIDIEYPVGDSVIEKSVDDLIKKSKDTLAKVVEESRTLPADAPGKSGLTIRYQVAYQTASVQSLLFTVSIMGRGAAHPSTILTGLNFVDGNEVTLSSLFQDGSSYLSTLSKYCKTQILAKNISDEPWVSQGTEASETNYKTWTFTDKGLAMIFEPYQVAAYVYGPQTVVINTSVFSSLLKPSLQQKIWG